MAQGPLLVKPDMFERSSEDEFACDFVFMDVALNNSSGDGGESMVVPVACFMVAFYSGKLGLFCALEKNTPMWDLSEVGEVRERVGNCSVNLKSPSIPTPLCYLL